ncbi:MAG: YbhN family protein [Nanoarchaeota archaeon]|nr:YbhN family protein [Nanoarchaeota archaeon]
MKHLKRYIYISLFIIIILLLCIFLKNNLNEVKQTISKISFTDFLILSISSMIGITLNGYKIKILTRHYKLKLKLKEWFGLSIITTMSNYLAPLGFGVSLKGVYLKKKYKFPYKLFIATLAISYLTSFLLYGFLGILIIVYIYLKYNFFNIILLSIFLIIFLANLTLILISPKIKHTKNKFLNQFIEIINNWNTMKKDWRLLIKLTINDFLSLINYSLRIYFIFYILSNKISFMFSTLMSLLSMSSLIIGLTPAAIGIKEIIIIYFTTIIGKSLDLGIIVAAIDRGLGIFYAFILGSIFSYVLLKNLQVKNP